MAKFGSKNGGGQEIERVKTLGVTPRLNKIVNGNFVIYGMSNGHRLLWVVSKNHQNRIVFHEFLILKSKQKGLNSKLGGCRICGIRDLFFNFFNEEEKDWSDPQPDSTIQPKARGLHHMERKYLAHHISTASKHPEVLGRLLDERPRSNQKDILTTWSTRWCLAKYSTPVGLGYEELGGLSDPGQRDCL